MNYELRIKKYKPGFGLWFLLFTILYSLFFIPNARAAEMFFVSSDAKPAIGEVFKVDLFINTEEKNINAMAGKIVFSGDILQLKEVRDGNSIVNLWMDRPALSSSGEVVFSGITPGGYKGDKGLLFSLLFSVVKSGQTIIKIDQGQTLLNDGKGTEVKLSVPPLTLQVLEKSDGKPGDYTLEDKTPPESFVPEVARDKNIADRKWFVVFVTQDKESGIDHYEVQETKHKNSYGDWQTATSPYILQDQSLGSFIYIKAVDKAGNATLAVVSPKKSLFSYGRLLVYGIILAILVLAFLGKRSYRRRV